MCNVLKEGDFIKVKITIPGEPQGKERPRFNAKKKITYTPQKTKNYEEFIATIYKLQGRHFFTGCVKADIKAYYRIPKSDSKNKRQLKLDGKIRPSKKPDVDNIIKAVLDALNGVAYTDDAAIVEANIKKYYSNDPRIELTLEDVEGE